jgi:hypothetical protein
VVVHDNVAAFLCEALYGHGAEAAAAPGYEDVAVLEIVDHC